MMQKQKPQWLPSDVIHMTIVVGLLVIAGIHGVLSIIIFWVLRTMPSETIVVGIVTGLLGFMGQKRAANDPPPPGTTVNAGDDTNINVTPPALDPPAPPDRTPPSGGSGVTFTLPPSLPGDPVRGEEPAKTDKPPENGG